jgi:hypothetical protein
MNFMISKQIESFDAKYSFVMVVFLYAQNFMNKFSLKLVVFSFFYNYNVVSTLLQIKNIFQLMIILFICGPISQHNDKLRCKPSLIANFHHNFFSISPPWCIKYTQVLKNYHFNVSIIIYSKGQSTFRVWILSKSS